jgi:undecaprenyl diphosphate synthase
MEFSSSLVYNIMKWRINMRNEKIDLSRLPMHVGIIMDGNGTWANKRNLPRNYGHKRGAKTLIDLVYYANEIGIKYLTVFAFSTENWKRPQEEVEFLMNLPINFLNENKEKLNKENIKINLIGRRDRINANLLQKINEAEEETKNNNGINFIIAFDYGSHDEIVRAVNKIIDDKLTTVDEETFARYLDTASIPSVDLLIRTSNQIRISNFLLWQIAYSELYFTNTLWPDFNKREFNKALIEYQKRERRFGGIK